MRHEDMPNIAILAFLGNLASCGLIAWVYSMVGWNPLLLISVSLCVSALVGLGIIAYYVFFGGFPITKKQIDETLGGLKG